MKKDGRAITKRGNSLFKENELYGCLKEVHKRWKQKEEQRS